MGKFKCDDCYDHLLIPRGVKCPSCPPDCPTCGRAAKVSPRAVEAFRNKLASRNWQHRVDAARRHLEIEPPIPSDDTFTEFAFTLSFPLTRLLGAQRVASGSSVDFAHPRWPFQVTGWLVEFALVAATLAAFLGTRSTQRVMAFLMCGLPLDPERLEPASPRTTALDDFAAACFQLLGAPSSPRKLVPRDNALVVYLTILAEAGVQDWDTRRKIWNRHYPGWHYDSTEAYRKACERALRRGESQRAG